MTDLSCIPCFLRFCALGALLVLDDSRLGQSMLSRPIVIGPLLGWYLGNPAQGTLLGAAVELLTLESLPIGPKPPINGTLAACAAIWVGDAASAPGFGLAGGLALGWAFSWAERLLRSLFDRINQAFEEGWRKGHSPATGLVLMIGTGAQFSWSFVALLAGARTLEWAAVAGRGLRLFDGFETALLVVPVLGFASTLSALRPKA